MLASNGIRARSDGIGARRGWRTRRGEQALARALARDVRRPRGAAVVAPDDGRRHRRGERPHDPRRRPVAGRLRVVQLPGLRPRSGDHRRRARVPRRVGHAPELVAPARQPRAVRGDRGAPDRPARLRGLARAADDHAHPHVGDPAARRGGHDLHRRAGPQDDLRRLPGRALSRRRREALPLRGPGAPGRAAAGRARPRAPHLHGRRQLHDRQRARPARVRPRRPRARRAAVRRRRARVRRHRRAHPGRDQPLRQPRQQRRAPLRRDVRQPRPGGGLLEGVLVAAGLRGLSDGGQEPAQGRGPAVPVLRTVPGRLARHRARRLRRQRAPRRRAARRSCGSGRSASWTAWSASRS